MAGRFSVIQGGRFGVAAAVAVPAEAATWRIELHRPNAVDEASVAAWRALMVRNAVNDPLRDPDHLLPLAQHRPAGRRVAVALAWSRDGAGAETLRGALPLAMPHPVWGGRARAWRPAEVAETGLVEGSAAEMVDAALRARLGGLTRPVRLASLPLVARPDRPARTRAARPIPAENLVGVRPQGWEPPAGAEASMVSEPAAIRDAVETLLALDARTAPAPIVADPSEASLVRVVSRLFARRRAAHVELFRRAGEIVAGTLSLGVGPAAVLWRRARA